LGKPQSDSVYFELYRFYLIDECTQGIFEAFKSNEYYQNKQDYLLTSITNTIWIYLVDETGFDKQQEDMLLLLCLVLVEDDQIAATLSNYIRYFEILPRWCDEKKAMKYKHVFQQLYLNITKQRCQIIGLDIHKYVEQYLKNFLDEVIV
jgi:hypothetical protein